MNIQLNQTENKGFSITGLTEDQYKAIQHILKTYLFGAELIQTMSLEESKHYFQSFNGGKAISDKEVQDLIQAELAGKQTIEIILEGISQVSEG